MADKKKEFLIFCRLLMICLQQASFSAINTGLNYVTGKIVLIILGVVLWDKQVVCWGNIGGRTP